MWQDLNDFVHVQDVNSKEILSFHNFPTYGQVMTSDLKHYFASDINWGIYEGYGVNQKYIKEGFDGDGFVAAGKLLNLTLSDDDKFLLTSGYAGNQGDDLLLIKGMTARDVNPEIFPTANFSIVGGIVLWNTVNNQPLHKFPGNIFKTIATISPDGKYIVSGDEDGNVFVWNALTGQLLSHMFNTTYTNIICKPNSKKATDCKTNLTGYPPIPKDLSKKYGFLEGHGDRIFNLKFIDLNGHYLHFSTTTPYAVLYQVTNPIPLKYLSLGKYPMPISRDPDDYYAMKPSTQHLQPIF